MKSIKKDVENLSFSSLALTGSSYEALVVLYKSLTCLASSCTEPTVAGTRLFLITRLIHHHTTSGTTARSTSNPQNTRITPPTQPPVVSSVEEVWGITPCNSCFVGSALSEKTLVIYANKKIRRLATECNIQTQSTIIPIPKCFQTFLVLLAF